METYTYEEILAVYNRLTDIWNTEVRPQGDLTYADHVIAEMHRLAGVRHETVTYKILAEEALAALKDQEEFNEAAYDLAKEAIRQAKENIEQLYHELVNMRAHSRFLTPLHYEQNQEI